MPTKTYHPHPVLDWRIVDGDTLELSFGIGWGVSLTEKLRLEGIEGGELPTPEGLRSKATLANTLAEWDPRQCRLLAAHHRRDQFNRLVGDILLPNGQLLTHALLRTGAFWRRDRTGKQHR